MQQIQRKQEHEQGSPCAQTTTAYTLSQKDEINLRIVTKDPASTTTTARPSSAQAKAASSDQAKAASNPNGELYSRKREVYSQAYNNAMSSSGPTLRSETKDKPAWKNYPDLHPKAREHYMERDTEAVAIVHEATTQAKGDKAKAASMDKAKVAINDQAKAVNNEKNQDGIVPLVTRDQNQEALKM